MIDFETYIKLVFVISAWCVGIFISAQDGNILAPVRRIIYNVATRFVVFVMGDPQKYHPLSSEWYANEVDRWIDTIGKPIIGCCPCMSSVHTILLFTGYSFYYHIHFTWWHIPFVMIIMASACMMNSLLINLINLLMNASYVLDKVGSQMEKMENDGDDA